MSSPVPLELQAKIADWRLRAADGTLTLEEMKEGVRYLRAGRVSAANAHDDRGRSRIQSIGRITAC